MNPLDLVSGWMMFMLIIGVLALKFFTHVFQLKLINLLQCNKSCILLWNMSSSILG